MKTTSSSNLYNINTQTGLVSSVEFIASPNFDARPKCVNPTLIVVHGISLPPNQFGGSAIADLFTNQLDAASDPYFEKIKGLKVSAHALIKRDGTLVQFVPFNQRAWHAGQSKFKGQANCNDFSVGIELEGTDFSCYTAMQYAVLARLIKSLREVYPGLQTANNDNIVGHSDIAPDRKTDPGAYFVWPALHRLLED
ncbi:1,6-anhydro-N-acetylmuramyl-L-alanine amidase AmpD [Thiomicrorhabdus aquaedulcis]|uniref:1,6-anhydro-N-acetylmuramyl-L-alanine amidase AmpD n=1 Tax=Thiomicrorhabdus aquaedulcis TaxID=2211106 RepID=UPI000FDB5627|nr:1,6-anhydro-N-acetylmuramyl-L-alanine amidase AmpD [Thiomicrorhabdus aquaedulcis]